MDCNNCKDKVEPVSYLAFESMKGSMERTIKRLWILLIILIVLLCGTNAAWIYYESQYDPFDTTEITQDVDTGNGDAVIAGIGDAIYGKGTPDDQTD